jgi:hypothetical protein
MAAVAEKCRKACELEKNVRGTQGTGEDEWYTPAKYIEFGQRKCWARSTSTLHHARWRRRWCRPRRGVARPRHEVASRGWL